MFPNRSTLQIHAHGCTINATEAERRLAESVCAPAGAPQRIIQSVNPVGGPNYDDLAPRIQPIHERQQCADYGVVDLVLPAAPCLVQSGKPGVLELVQHGFAAGAAVVLQVVRSRCNQNLHRVHTGKLKPCCKFT